MDRVTSDRIAAERDESTQRREAETARELRFVEPASIDASEVLAAREWLASLEIDATVLAARAAEHPASAHVATQLARALRVRDRQRAYVARLDVSCLPTSARRAA